MNNVNLLGVKRGQIKKATVGCVCRSNGINKKCLQNFGGNHQEKKSLRRTRIGWQGKGKVVPVL
jgi:hypothetical protein